MIFGGLFFEEQHETIVRLYFSYTTERSYLHKTVTFSKSCAVFLPQFVNFQCARPTRRSSFAVFTIFTKLTCPINCEHRGTCAVFPLAMKIISRV